MLTLFFVYITSYTLMDIIVVIIWYLYSFIGYFCWLTSSLRHFCRRAPIYRRLVQSHGNRGHPFVFSSSKYSNRSSIRRRKVIKGMLMKLERAFRKKPSGEGAKNQEQDNRITSLGCVEDGQSILWVLSTIQRSTLLYPMKGPNMQFMWQRLPSLEIYAVS